MLGHPGGPGASRWTKDILEDHGSDGASFWPREALQRGSTDGTFPVPSIPNSCGNSSQRMATEVLMPWKTDTVKEAPMANPSMKLCSPSLRVIIHASVPMSE